MVADRKAGGACAGSASGAVTVGGRESGNGGGAGVAESECVLALAFPKSMSIEWKHRGRIIIPDDVHFIQQLIDANPQASRRQLSEKLCEAWQWKQANGALPDMVCRGLLLMLDRAGQIQLPPIKKRPNNLLARRPKPAPLLIDPRPIQGSLTELQPIDIQQVR
jgi:hypothetical protein